MGRSWVYTSKIGGFLAVDGVALSTVEIWNAAQAGKGCVSRTEPTIRVPASGLSQRSVPEARILWLEAKVTLIFPPSEIGVGMEAQVPCGGSHPPFPCRAIFCLVIPVNLFQS